MQNTFTREEVDQILRETLAASNNPPADLERIYDAVNDGNLWLFNLGLVVLVLLIVNLFYLVKLQKDTFTRKITK